jgi:hypothetical protein
MAKVPGFAKAFAGRWRIAETDKRGVLREKTRREGPRLRSSGFVCARG